MNIEEKIAQMQASKNQPRITEPTKLSNGKWMHPFSQIQWDDEISCRTDYRFCKEWGRK